MSVQAVAIKRAVRILDALGAKYTISLPDGQEFKKGSRRAKDRHSFTDTKYNEIVPKLKVGEAQRFPFNGHPAQRLRSAIAARASTSFGKESCITHVDKEKGHIEILRVK